MSNPPRELSAYEPYLRLVARNYLAFAGNVHYDANDLVQETLTRAYQNRAQFRGSSDAEFTGWLRKILRNHLQDLLQRSENRFANDVRFNKLDDSFVRLEEMVVSNDSTPGRRAARKEQVAFLGLVLQQLPEDQRLAIELRHLQGLPLLEIAARLNRSPAAVGSLLYRALQALRKNLQDPDSTS